MTRKISKIPNGLWFSSLGFRIPLKLKKKRNSQSHEPIIYNSKHNINKIKTETLKVTMLSPQLGRRYCSNPSPLWCRPPPKNNLRQCTRRNIDFSNKSNKKCKWKLIEYLQGIWWKAVGPTRGVDWFKQKEFVSMNKEDDISPWNISHQLFDIWLLNKMKIHRKSWP